MHNESQPSLFDWHDTYPEYDVVHNDLCQPTLIEASAGTGKTFSMKHIVLRLIVEYGFAIEKCLILSFTQAATQELSARIQAYLQEALSYVRQEARDYAPLLKRQFEVWDASGLDRTLAATRLEQALERFDLACISTIHSFCSATLKQKAYSSGASMGSFERVEDVPQLRAEVIEEFLNGLPSEVTKALPALDWDALLATLSQYPPDLVPVQLEVDEYAKRHGLQEAIETFITWAPQALRQKKAARRLQTFDDFIVELWLRLKADTTHQLHQSLRSSFEAVLIDEFQDTDIIQYSIFKSIFLSPEALAATNARAFILVGDPKQAIYRFRSADLNTYLKARDTLLKVGGVYALSTNYRSSAPLIEALNTIYGASSEDVLGQGPFLNRSLRYQPVKAGSHNGQLWVRESVNAPWQAQSAVVLTGVTQAAADAKALTGEVLAQAIARLIDLGQRQCAMIEVPGENEVDFECEGRRHQGRFVRPSDIAILVDRRSALEAVLPALERRHVGYKQIHRKSVFSTMQAYEILAILKAFDEPQNNSVVTAARVTTFMGDTLESLAQTTEAQRVSLRTQFEKGYRYWLKLGVAAAFQVLDAMKTLPERLLKIEGGHRMLVNYEHLIEILHEVGRERTTPSALLHWFEAQLQSQEDIEKYRIRDGDDGDLVVIETIHGSKGLQYPIVFWTGFSKRDSQKALQAKSFIFYENAQNDQPTLRMTLETVAAPESVEYDAICDKVRWVYVAMTRAIHQLNLVDMQRRRSEKSPQQWYATASCSALFQMLMGQTQSTQEAIEARVRAVTQACPHVALQRVEASCPDEVDCTVVATSAHDDVTLSVAPSRAQRVQWKTTSFTGITRLVDDASDLRPMWFGEREAERPTNDILNFARGAQAGTCLHSILEEVDFEQVADTSDRAVVARQNWVRQKLAGLMNFESPQALENATQAVSQMLVDVLTSEVLPNFRLCQLTRQQRQAEVGFLMTLKTTQSAKALSDFLAKYDPKYHVPHLKPETLKGYLTGFIDLVFEHQGQFWILDWKSNAISQEAKGFTEQAMQQEMRAHHYGLQYLIYWVALRRLMKVRLGPRYRDEMIGGALYVFLRGVRKEDTTPAHLQGVVLDRVDPKLIEALDAFFDGDVSTVNV